jgi:hypothetical protein
MPRAMPVSAVIVTPDEARAAFEREAARLDAQARIAAPEAFEKAASDAEAEQAARQSAYDRDNL